MYLKNKKGSRGDKVVMRSRFPWRPFLPSFTIHKHLKCMLHEDAIVRVTKLVIYSQYYSHRPLLSDLQYSERLSSVRL